MYILDVYEGNGPTIEEDTIIFSNVQSGSSAVYQCNASNEFGYLLANAFVSVLGKLNIIQLLMYLQICRDVYKHRNPTAVASNVCICS